MVPRTLLPTSVDEPLVSGGDEVKPSINQMQTVGTHLPNLNALGLTTAPLLSNGETATEPDLSAYMIALKGQYKFTHLLGSAVHYLSGTTIRIRSSPLLTRSHGTHHKFMARWTTLRFAFWKLWFADIYGSLIFKPDNKLTIDLLS